MADQKSPKWLPIEANPEVMNKFLHSSGLTKTWAVQDVFGLDEPLLAMLPQPVLSLLLLFPINDKDADHSKEVEERISAQPAAPASLFFMKQTISNACGTVALLHAVANGGVDLEDGPLKKFIDECKTATPEERAAKLEDFQPIIDTHDAVAREGQTAAPNLDDRVDHHFVAFVEKEGVLYELDGRKSGPLNCGKVEKEDFLKLAAAECRKYMERDPENLNFSVMALAKAE